MLNLVVKNFGVLKDIDIELNHTNLFIGDNGSGKSTLAKLITVVTDITLDEEGVSQKLQDFGIDFLNEDCFIELKEINTLIIKIVSSKIEFSELRKIANKKLKQLESNLFINHLINEAESKDKLNDLIEQVAKSDINLSKKIIEDSKNIRSEDLTNLNRLINNHKSKYIPAERNLISLFNQSLSNILTARIPLPKTLLEFSAHYNSARNEIKELDILNIKYKNENSQDRIYYDDQNSLALENSSSGIQTALPLYLTVKYFASKHSNIIIEEPELNLYPLSQIETVKFMIEHRGESSISIMTHSPYILSIINVLIFAYKATNTNNILKEKISKIIPEIQQINPDKFSAYLIEDGTAISIKGKSTGMIQENVIDEIGDGLTDNFEELMEIYREFKSVE